MSYDTLIKFGYVVKQTRLQHGWELSHLADKLGITTSELISIERGVRDVSIVQAKAFASALDISITDLI